MCGSSYNYYANRILYMTYKLVMLYMQFAATKMRRHREPSAGKQEKTSNHYHYAHHVIVPTPNIETGLQPHDVQQPGQMSIDCISV